MKLQLLLTDDDPFIRKTLSLVAKSTQLFDIVEAENGAEAIASMRRAMPHILVTDWEMPIVDGPKVVRALRELPGGDDVVVLMLTARASEGNPAGADEYCTKPIKIPEFKKLLMTLSERPRGRASATR